MDNSGHSGKDGNVKLTPEHALQLLETSGQPPEIIAHCKAVACYAQELARQAQAAGASIDEELLFSAALIHDIRRTSENHAAAGAAYLQELGFDDVASIVAVHMDLPDGRENTMDEASLLYLADKSVKGTERISLEERLAAELDRGNLWAQHRLEQAIAIRNLIEG